MINNEIQGNYNTTIQHIHDSSIEITLILSKSHQYQDLLEQLESQQDLLALTPKDNVEKRLKISRKINDLENLIEQFKRDVLTLAQTFGHLKINTERLRRAKEFFDEGELNEARFVLEVELDQMNVEQERLLARREEFEADVLPKLNHNSEEFLVLALTKQFDYENPNRFVETCDCFERSIKSFVSENNLIKYGIFLLEHNETDKARKYLEQHLTEFSNKLSFRMLAYSINVVALVYFKQKEYDKALSKWQEALEIDRKLVEDCCGSPEHLHHFAIVLNNLGALHNAQGDFDKALDEFEEVINIYRKLIEEAEIQSYKGDLALVISNMGIVYETKGEYDEALCKFEEAKSIYQQLAIEDGQKYEPEIAGILIHIGHIYLRKGKDHKALYVQERALEIYRQTAVKNPHALLPNVARSLACSAIVREFLNEYEKALLEYEEALNIYREFAKRDSITFLPEVTKVLTFLANYFQESVPQQEKSIEFAIEAITIIIPIAETIPSTHRDYIYALNILIRWGLTDEEIEQRIDEIKSKTEDIFAA